MTLLQAIDVHPYFTMPSYAFLISFSITINKPEILNRIWAGSLEMTNKIMYFAFPYPVIMVKSHEKKCRKYFFKIITTTTVWWNVAEMWILKKWIKWILSVQQKKNYGFWSLWGIFKEWDKQNIIMSVLRKQIFIQLPFADWWKNQ